MKRYIYTLCVILVGSSCLLSCFSEDKVDTTVYYETAITKLELVAVNRYIHTISKKGEDSVYQKKLTTFPQFTIDEANRTIYNTDSLPSDCDLSHILVQLTTTNRTGTLFWKAIDSDNLTFFSSVDSVNLTVPRELRAYNNNGTLYRAYTVTINKHTQATTNKIIWEERSASEFPDYEGKEQQKWEALVKAAGLKEFIGCASKEAYAFSNDNQLMVTRDEGKTWVIDELDSDAKLLPTQNVAFVNYPLKSNITDDYVLLVGDNDDHEEGMGVWRKIVENSDYTSGNRWVYMPIESYNKYYLPKNDSYGLVFYNDVVLAFRGDDSILVSRDGGITWKEDNAKYPLPSSSLSGQFDVTTDGGYIWYKDNENGKVWRGGGLEK